MTATSQIAKRTRLGPDFRHSCDGQSPFLALDTRPNYIDTTPMPATSAKWKYRAIYSND
jgi:hypothetical protein